MTELDPLSRALLSAAAGCHEPSRADRDRVRQRLMVRLGVAAGLGALGSAATHTSPAMAASASGAMAESTLTGAIVGSAKLLVISKVVGITALISAAGFGGYEWVSSTNPPETHTAVVASAQRAPRPSAKAHAASSAPVSSATSEPPQRNGFERAAVPPGRAPERATASVPSVQASLGEVPQTSRDAPALPPVAAFPSDSPSLAAEARGLARAQAALREGNAAQALSLLDQQNTQFSQGSLEEERSAARVFALCKMGHAREANAAAADFLRRSPHSVLAERVANACPASK